MPDTQISEEMVERAAAAIRELTGPYLGTPEQIAKHGERIRLRQEESARKFARAALVAALSGHVVGWRTMDSAPKDGTHVILGITGDDPPGYGYVAEGYYEEDGDRGWYKANTHWTDAYDGQLYPSHWQPLPAPPVPEMEG